MPSDARIDLQPAAQDLHHILQSCTGDVLKETVAGPGADPSEFDAAAKALQSLSSVVTGPDTLPASLNLEYIHRSTSHHVARSSRQGQQGFMLGKLPVGHEHAFHISFKGGLKCTLLGREDAAKLATQLSSGVGGFLGIDWGDVWDNVTEAVYAVTDVVISVLDGVVQAVVKGIDLIKQGAEWVWNGVVKLATEIGDIASAVFDAIKATWDRLIAWLGFLFEWDDIKRTARVFEGQVHSADAMLLVCAPLSLQLI